MRFLFLLVLLLNGGTLLFSQTADRSPLISAGAVWRVDAPDYFAVTLPADQEAGGTPKEAAVAFLSVAKTALGARPDDEFNWQRTSKGQDGRYYVRFTQERAGYPVFGRELTVCTDAAGGVSGVNGTPLDVSFIAPAPAPASLGYPSGFTAPELQIEYPEFHQWSAEPAGRLWASASPWDHGAAYVLTDVYDVYEPAGYRGERVYLNATTGKLVFHHPLHCDLNRQLYHVNTQNANLEWSENDAFPGSLDAEDQELLTATAEVYNLYRYTLGRDGYDGNDGLMRGISRRQNSCPNASASGNVTSFCAGVVTDDIVAHEWGHNYTGEMNGLIYAWESGALNEGYADIFGETVDLLNNRGNDAGDATPRTGCGSGIRWQMGEDATSFGGAIRDMYSPECYNDPSARNSGDYWCNTGDNGGVHINSGLVNRTYSLLVDGGTLNGTTVAAIGMTKALHIFFHAADNYMGRVTDFSAWAVMLEQSTQDLTGVNLTALTLLDQPPGASGEIITAADLVQVQNAIAATQLNGSGPCTMSPTLAQNPPEACSVNEDFTVLLAEDWENGTGSWTLTELPEHPGTWDPKPWAINTELPDGRPGQGLFAPDPRGGDCQDDLENGEVFLTSPVVCLPEDVLAYELRFNHYYSTENGYDGGLLYLSRNGGTFDYLPNAAFVYNGYDDALVGSGGNDNPAAGLETFNGSDGGSTSGTWGTSVIDLEAAGVEPGDDIRLRWSMSHDGCNGWLGWYIDEIVIGYCPSAVLPVTYTTLSATPAKDHILVEWATEAEEANAGFYVERRSGNAAGFTSLGFTSLGFVAAGGDYRYEDHRVSGGVPYVYRLRQVDLDGTENLSNLVSASLSGPRPLSVYPNPNKGIFTVLAGEGVVHIHDVNGRLVRSTSLQDGRTTVAGLERGVYIVRVNEEVRRVLVR